MIVDKINTSIINISLNIHGTRVVQILIEKLSKSINENINVQINIIKDAPNKFEDFEKIKGFKINDSHNQCHKILLQVISYL
jgi:hypothetical protein